MKTHNTLVSSLRAFAGAFAALSLAFAAQLHAQPVNVPADTSDVSASDDSTVINLNDSTGSTIPVTVGASGGSPVAAAAVLASGNSIFNLSGAGFTSTGTLYLGWLAADVDPSTFDNTAGFSGMVDLTGLDANTFGGVELDAGALRINSAAQLGAPLSLVNFGKIGTATTTGTLIVAAGGDATFDGPANHLAIVSTGNAITINLEPGAMMTFSNINSTIVGAAISFAASSTLTLAAGDGAQYVFSHNTSSVQGGAIGAQNGVYMDITNALFDSNTAGNNGGALFVNSGNSGIRVVSSTFINNGMSGGNGGGAITIGSNANNYISATGVYFGTNSSPSGGAIYIAGATGTVTVTNATFANNTATGVGGAIGISANGAILNFTDVSFMDNSAGGMGGAIGLNTTANSWASTINLTVSDGSTSRFAGNTELGSAATPNSIHVNVAPSSGAATQTLAVNVGEGGLLDMLDPFTIWCSGGAGDNVYVTKDGLGTWKLAGSSTIAKQGNNAGTEGSFTINAGKLYLYGANEPDFIDPISGKHYPVAAGSINLVSGNNNANVFAKFIVAEGATLGVGGGNSINFQPSPAGNAGTLSFAPHSIIDFNLNYMSPGNTIPMLTISTQAMPATNTTFIDTTNHTLNPDLVFDFDISTLQPGTYNLLTLLGTNNGALLGTIDAAGLASMLTNATFAGFSYTDLHDDYALNARFNVSSNVLQVIFSEVLTNGVNVLTWTGAASDQWASDANWTLAGDSVAFSTGAVVNFDGSDIAGHNTIAVADPVTVAGIYFSGDQSYAITGAAITADASSADPAKTPTATGKLILGAKAGDDGVDTPDTTVAFTGVLDLTRQTGANDFTGGVDIYSGALRIKNTDQLGTTLSGLSFLGATASTTGTLVIAGGNDLAFDSGVTGTENHLAIGASNAAAFALESGATLTFSSNTMATSGGAITLAGNNASLLLAAASDASYLFTSNTTAGSGGAIYGSGAGGVINLTNVSFTNNTAGANGGAIAYDDAGTLDLKINTTIGTSTFSGNMAGSAANSIYYARTANGTGTITINTQNGSTLDMQDPMNIIVTNNNYGINIIKQGDGTWKLAGTTNVNKNNVNNPATVDITEGMLYLYRADETSNGAGNISLGGNGTGRITFTLRSSATLGIGGGNSISVPTSTDASAGLIFEGGSVISYDIKGAASLSNATSLLTLDPKGAGVFTFLNGSVLNPTIDFSTLAIGDFNILTAGTLLTDSLNSDAFNYTFKGDTLAPDNWSMTSSIIGNSLWVTFAYDGPLANNILTWVGTGPNWLTDANWSSATVDTFATKDVVNFDGTPTANTTVTLADTATAGGMYVSGGLSYTMSGAGIVTDNTNDTDIPSAASASGKLVLGAKGTASSIDITTFTGVLDLTQQDAAAVNNFTRGIDIYSGALKVDTTAHLGLGAGIAGLNFLGASPDTSGTLLLTQSITFDNTGARGLVITDGKSGAIDLAPGQTATFKNGYANSSGAALTAQTGGAISLGLGATLILTTEAGASWVFDSNTAASTGGAIYTATGAFLSIDNVTFTNNQNSSGNSAAVFNNGGTIAMTSATFTGNQSASNGALGNQGVNGVVTVTNAYFANNTGANGAALLQNINGSTGYTTITSATFYANTATASNGLGGAIYINQNGNATAGSYGVLNLNDVVFASNTAAATGGAMADSGNTGVFNFTNVSFTSNTAATNGGAYYDNNATVNTITYYTTDGKTSLVAGNMAGGQSNGFYFVRTAASATLTFTATTDLGATLDMLDPMTLTQGNATNAQVSTFTKSGAGVWKLGGNNTFAALNAATITTFNVNEGTLYLYRADEKDATGVYTAATGNLNIAGAGSTFNLATSATLAIGGGNSIAAPTISLANNSILSFDLNLADYGSIGGLQTAGDGPSLLTLNATTLTAGSGTTFNFGLNFTGAEEGTYNLITGNTGIFTAAGNDGLTGFLFTGGITGLDGVGFTDGITGSTLWITIGGIVTPPTGNSILTWTGATSADWLATARDSNWKTADTAATPTVFTQGDIVNLDSTNTGTNDITLDATATVLAMNVSGTATYTITGNGNIVADPAADSTILDDNPLTPAATGKLILGANATDPAAAPDTSAASAFTGVLDLTGQTGDANDFVNGVDLNGGALRISATGQLGTTLSGVTFAGGTLAIAKADVAFDSAGGATQRIAIAADASGAIAVESGATLTLSGNSNGAGYAGALYVRLGSTFSLTAADPAGIVFADNTAYVGGAIANLGNLEVKNATFTGNTANFGGAIGGYYAYPATATLTGVTFTSNTAAVSGDSEVDGMGGAIYATGRTDIIGALFQDNTAVTGGGALATGSSSLTNITDAIFAGNTALQLTNGKGNVGGAFWITDSSTVTLSGVTFSDNHAVNAAGNGGAIYIENNGDLSVLSGSGVLFEGNTAGSKGGAILNNGSEVDLTDATFTSNTAGVSGGAIYNNGALTLTLTATTDITSAGNTAADAVSGGFLFQAAGAVANFDVASGATLTIGATDAVGADTIASADATSIINKTGAGTLVLNATSYGYLGDVNVLAGSLLLGNSEAQLSGNINAGNDTTTGAIVGGQGAFSGNVLIYSGNALQVGLTHSTAISDPENLYVGNLTLADGASLLTYVFSNGTDANLLTANTLAIGTTGTIDINTLASGTFQIIQTFTPFDDAAALALDLTHDNGTPIDPLGRVQVSSSVTPDKEQYWLTIAITNISSTWTGAFSSTWDSSGSNWINPQDHVFYAGDAVTFNDPSAASTVDVATAGVSTVGMVVDTADGFTFTGGAITTSTNMSSSILGTPAATGKLTKTGAGALVFKNTANFFEDGIDLNAGSITGNADTLAIGPAAAISTLVNTTLTFAQDTDAEYASTITGAGNFVKDGSANLKLAGTTDFEGTTSVSSGILTLGAADQIASSSAVTIVAGATLDATSGAQHLNQLGGAGNLAAGSGALTLSNSAADTTFSGVISGAASVTKLGANTLTLDGDNTFAGGLAISEGAVQLGNGSAAGTVTGTIDIASGATLDLDHGSVATALNAVSGNGIINKLAADTGALTVSTANTFTGTTNIQGGSLVLAPAAALLGQTNLLAATSLVGTGTLHNLAAISATITIGDIGSAAGQVLTLTGTLALNGGNTLNYDISGTNTSDRIDAAALARNGAETIDVNLNTTLTGTYALIHLTTPATIDATALTFHVNNAAPTSRVDYSFSTDASTLYLDLLTKNIAGVVWDGTNTGAWMNTGANWQTTNGNDRTFLNGDAVIFDNSALGTHDVVVDSQGVQVIAMTVSSTTPYTFTGGAITDSSATPSSLAGTADATGKLTLDSANKALVTLANGANVFDGGIIINGGTLQGDTTTLGAATPSITTAAGAALVFSQSTSVSYDAAITGAGLLVKQAAGTLTLTNVANTYVGGITVHAGALDLAAPSPIGAITIDNAAALNLTNLTSAIGAATVNGTLKITNAAAYDITAAVTGAGLLDITTGAGNAIGLGGISDTGFTGTISLGASKYTLGANLTHATLALGAGNETTIGSTPVTIGNLAINGAKLDFATTVPADTAAPGLITTTALTLGSGTIQVNIPGAAAPAPSSAQASLFAQASGNVVDKLIVATGNITGAATVATNFKLVDVNGDDLTTGIQQADIVQGAVPATVATGTYNYFLSATGGLNVNYGLTALTIINGSTLTLQPLAGESGVFSATISGNNATLDIAGATPVTLDKQNNFAGAINVADNAGLVAGANGSLGAAANTLALGNKATFDLAGKTQTLASVTAGANSTLTLGGASGVLTVTNLFNTAAGSTFDFAGGALNVASGTINGALTGAGALNVTGGNLVVNFANPNMSAPTDIHASATATIADLNALGKGDITLDGPSAPAAAPAKGPYTLLAAATPDQGVLIIANTAGGILANNIHGGGSLNFNGPGAVAIEHDNALTGAVAINNGSVTASTLGALGSGAIDIASKGALAFAAPGTLNNTITDDGSLTLDSAGGVLLAKGAITGAGTMNLAGAIELDAANNVSNINLLDYSEVVARAASSLGTANTNLTLSNAALTLAAPDTTLGNVTMKGASILGYAKDIAPGAKLNITSLKSDSAGATISLNIDVGASKGDFINLTTANPADNSGLFGVALNNTGAAPTVTGTNPIPSIKFIDATKLGSAAIISSGSFQVTGLKNFINWSVDTTSSIEDDSSINFTKGGLTGGAKNALAAATGAMPLAWLTELDTLAKRLGDLQIDPRETPGMDLWARAYAQRINVNDKDSPVPFHETQYGTEVGVDFGGRPTGYGAATYVGAFIGYGGSSRDVDGVNGSGNMNSVYGGLYATFITPDGWYADLVGKYNHFKSTFSADGSNADFGNDAFGASIEAGKRLVIDANWFVTPSAQASIVRVYGKDYTMGGSGSRVNLEQTTSRQVRAGAEAGYKIVTKAGQIWQPYAKAYFAQQWTNGGQVRQDNNDPDIVVIKGSRIDLGVGVNWQILKTLQVYFDYECSFAKDYTKPYGLTLGANYAW